MLHLAQELALLQCGEPVRNLNVWPCQLPQLLLFAFQGRGCKEPAAPRALLDITALFS